MATGDAATPSESEQRLGAGEVLEKFMLYETLSNFYVIGRNKCKTQWKVLKIDRLETSELNIFEDSTIYSKCECNDLLKRIHEGNRSTGGLKFVTNCYGIAGFIKFLGPYYMLLITKRRKIGDICGQAVYAVAKSEMIALPKRSNIANTKNENSYLSSKGQSVTFVPRKAPCSSGVVVVDVLRNTRYKKLLCSVDLTKDFFFSYSYQVMRSLQKNICDHQTGQVLYETMFVWNEFLTRTIRNHLKSSLWTVALVYGFFKQTKLSISGKIFRLTLIARRSRHFAGTRYLKRGVNEKGRVANDVETEQIVFEDYPLEIPSEISSVVQNRGSIPLFWSQEASWLNLKPDIILHKKDKNYEATRLHFENLAKRYGHPIIILNLIKMREKKPRESKLRAEFAKAINIINKDLSEEHRLRFLHWDLNKHSRSKATNVLVLLGKVAAYALNLTGFFYCQVTPALGLQSSLKQPIFLKEDADTSLCNSHDVSSAGDPAICLSEPAEDSAKSAVISPKNEIENSEPSLSKPPLFQKGVLRTNCIDCLDRANVAQYAYGLAALGYQLHALGIIEETKIGLHDPLADDLMSFYERMGDTLSLQYGGSTAHNKIFSERRGQWKATTQSQEFFRTLQRYYSNSYMDAEKQDAMNLFLGHFQPHLSKPALWELDSDQHYSVGRIGHAFAEENVRSSIKRSLSDGNILSESNMPVSLHRQGDASGSSDIPPEISACECDISYSRYDPTMPNVKLFLGDNVLEHGFDSSNFLHPDWLSSSGNSVEEICERFSPINSPTVTLSAEDILTGISSDTTSTRSENESSSGGREADDGETSYDAAQASEIPSNFPDSFAHWVVNGGTIYSLI